MQNIAYNFKNNVATTIMDCIIIPEQGNSFCSHNSPYYYNLIHTNTSKPTITCKLTLSNIYALPAVRNYIFASDLLGRPIHNFLKQ